MAYWQAGSTSASDSRSVQSLCSVSLGLCGLSLSLSQDSWWALGRAGSLGPGCGGPLFLSAHLHGQAGPAGWAESENAWACL